MRQSRYINRLRQELPLWVEKGWVKAEDQQDILDYTTARQGSETRRLPLIFSLMGVLVLAAGVISFFAANWPLMPKLAKLALLFGAMWSAYGLSAYFLKRTGLPHLGEAMLLLGVLLFGANIMLIAQIYHIDAHYPNGILTWSLGALLVAYLAASQAALTAAVVLAVLWTAMENWGFGHRFHWPFLLLWAAFLPPVYRGQWRLALHTVLAALLLWSWFTWLTPPLGQWGGTRAALLQVYFLAYLGLFLLGMLMETSRNWQPFSGAVRHYATFAALMSLFPLTFPRFSPGRALTEGWGAAPVTWILATAIATAAVAALTLWHRKRAGETARLFYLRLGRWLLVPVVTLLWANLLLDGSNNGTMAVWFNLVLIAGLVWLIYAGLHGKDRFLVNLAFVFFALTLLARYFDTFWTLLNRSYFFMLGGLLLIGGGYWLERQRRKLTRAIPIAAGSEGTP